MTSAEVLRRVIGCSPCRGQRWVAYLTPPTTTYEPCGRCNSDGAVLPRWWPA